ncbi:MAG: hypothetical protein ACPGXK_13620 [Phycisphaerae bacterium]
MTKWSGQWSLGGKRLFQVVAVACLVVSNANEAVAQCGVHSDILIGRSGAGQLVIQSGEVSVGDPVSLCPVDGILDGFSSGNPGFDAEEVVDDPANDFFKLADGAIVSIEAVSIGSGFKAWGPGLGTLIDEPGESILLGDDNLHEHLTWHADSNDPSFDPTASIWTATFRVVDAGSTGYTASEPFEMQFFNGTPVPAASEWGLLVMLGGLIIVATLMMRPRLENA